VSRITDALTRWTTPLIAWHPAYRDERTAADELAGIILTAWEGEDEARNKAAIADNRASAAHRRERDYIDAHGALRTGLYAVMSEIDALPTEIDHPLARVISADVVSKHLTDALLESAKALHPAGKGRVVGSKAEVAA
jgi:hypothetical protein